MALAVDTSTPALAAASNDPWTTASFTPPNDSLLVAVVMADWFVSTPTITVTSTGLTFTSRIKVGALNEGVVEIFTAPVGASGGTARTVSATTSLASDVGGIKVYVITGQHATPVDTTGSGSSTTNNITPTVLTTGFDGCWVFGGGTEWNSNGVPTSTDVGEGFDDADLSLICVRKSAATSPAGAVTLNFDSFGGSAAQWTWAAISIRPTATSGVTVSPTGIATTEAFGAVAVVLSLAVSPAGINTAEAFGTPAVSATLTVSPAAIASAEALGSPTISATLTASPEGIASAEAFGTPTALVGGAVAPEGIATAEAFGILTATTTLTVVPAGVATGESLGAPTVTTSLAVSPTGIASAEALGSPVITEVYTASPTGIASGEAFGTLAVTTTLTVSPVGIASGEAFGTLTISTIALRDITVIASIRNNHVTGGVVLSNLIAGLRSNHVTGGVDVPRNLRTGSVEYVTAEVTFVGETAASIATATGQVQITTTDTTPTAADPNWVNADVTTRTDVTGGAKLSLSKLHTAGAAATYRLWAKVTDNPEVPILLCGSFDVRA